MKQSIIIRKFQEKLNEHLKTKRRRKMNLIVIATIFMIIALIFAVIGFCIVKINDVTNGSHIPEVICFVLAVILIVAAFVLYMIQLINALCVLKGV